MNTIKICRYLVLATLLTSTAALLGCPSRTAIISGAVACFAAVPPAPARASIDGVACTEGDRSVQCDLNPGAQNGGAGTGVCNCKANYPGPGFAYRCKSIDSTSSIKGGVKGSSFSTNPNTGIAMDVGNGFTHSVCAGPEQTRVLNLNFFRDAVNSDGLAALKSAGDDAVYYLLGLDSLAAYGISKGYVDISVGSNNLCQVAVDLRANGAKDEEVENLYSVIFGSED